eukprot:gnl/MRDRNA2_/MRDRNA2_173265_c0_seq1.p1 gnl/MRDRNA2_/MRDRNA2_173265_c0~~gnl/MRDRNA2_/MRDRNA2_173265_c0_seq1.p1  ORF type:complete len:503 (+),score=53.19 gnl/MRDRNA2_/MRDRNA2_173265_c0_seq1:147-1511(+)
MVTHCLQNNFEALLQRSEYVKIDSLRIGHKLYSAMMQRDNVFDQALNPMLPDEYELLVSNVKSLRGILREWPAESTDAGGGVVAAGGTVLFLFFNCERRSALSQAGVLQLYEQLCAQSRYPFQLLVVNIVTTSGELRPRHRLLLHQTRKADQAGCVHEHVLFVHELRCVGTHDSNRFAEAVDKDALRTILLDGAVSSEGPSATCHLVRRYFDLSPGPPVMDTTAAAVDGGVQTTPNGVAGGVENYKLEKPKATRLERFESALLQAQKLQEHTPGSLKLMGAPLRKLLRHLGRALDAPSTQEPNTRSRVSQSQAAEQDQSWRSLHEALFCHAVHITKDGLCRIWCPYAELAHSALQVIMQWEPPVVIPSSSLETSTEVCNGANANTPCALLVLPASLVRAQLNDTAIAFASCLEIVYVFKHNMELFTATEPSSQTTAKLPRSAQEFVVVGRRSVP